MPGAAYVPFIGDGDLAVAHYADRLTYGADIDPERVKTARGRLPSADIREADCDGWPFAGITEPFAIADFDAYANPYKSLVAFWANAEKCKRIVLFGTDGMRYRIKRARVLRSLPEGTETPSPGLSWRGQYNFWWTKHVLPYLASLLTPWKIREKMSYTRGAVGVLYWGLVASR